MKQLGSRLIVLLTRIGFGLFSGCKENDPVPLEAEVKAKLLAGESGSSKSWKLVTVVGKEGTKAEQTFTLAGCEADNIYKFSNNAAQEYEESEGATKCSALDATVVEKGTWAFTLDGTMLVILNTTLSSNSDAFSFSQFFPYPGQVVELSDSIMKIKMTYTFDGIVYVYNFTFNKN